MKTRTDMLILYDFETLINYKGLSCHIINLECIVQVAYFVRRTPTLSLIF